MIERRLKGQCRRRREREGFLSAWMYIETWRVNIELLWPPSGKRLTGEMVERFIKRRFGFTYSCSQGWDARCLEVLNDAGVVISNVICLSRWDARRPLMHGNLVHECFHATEYILERAEVKHSSETSEVFAYLLGDIHTRCMEVLRKQ